MDGATQLFDFLAGPQKSALSRLLAIDRWHKHHTREYPLLQALPQERIDFTAILNAGATAPSGRFQQSEHLRKMQSRKLQCFNCCFHFHSLTEAQRKDDSWLKPAVSLLGRTHFTQLVKLVKCWSIKAFGPIKGFKMFKGRFLISKDRLVKMLRAILLMVWHRGLSVDNCEDNLSSGSRFCSYS